MSHLAAAIVLKTMDSIQIKMRAIELRSGLLYVQFTFLNLPAHNNTIVKLLKAMGDL